MQFSDDIRLCSGIMNFCASESLSFSEGKAKTEYREGSSYERDYRATKIVIQVEL